MNNLELLFENFISQVANAEMKSPKTVRGYRASLSLLKRFMLETHHRQMSISDITEQTMVDFFTYLNTRERVVGRGQIRTTVKPSTVATYRGKLLVFFKWLHDHGKLKTENPFKNIKYPKFSYEDKKYMDKAEINSLLAAIDHGIPWENDLIKKRTAAMAAICLNLGLRKGELLGLELRDLNFQTELLTVRAETSKSRRMRVLKMNRDILSSLNDYLLLRNTGKYKTPALWVSNQGDHRFSEGGLIHLVRRLKEKGGVKDFHLHRMRHTFAVNYYKQSGGDIIGLQRILGHTDIDMTKKYLRGLPLDWTDKDLDNFSLGKAI